MLRHLMANMWHALHSSAVGGETGPSNLPHCLQRGAVEVETLLGIYKLHNQSFLRKSPKQLLQQLFSRVLVVIKAVTFGSSFFTSLGRRSEKRQKNRPMFF